LYTYGIVWKFTVTPGNLGVGQFPVFYDFLIQPSGEVPKGSRIIIGIPKEVIIQN
jgi:hypothetical protein